MPRETGDFAQDELTVSHQLDLRDVPFADQGKPRLFEIGVDPERVGVDHRNDVPSDARVVSHLRQKIGDPAIHGRAELCTVKIDLRLISADLRGHIICYYNETWTHTWLWIGMCPFLAQFSEPAWSGHLAILGALHQNDARV
jgi:hypothetical protein